MNRKSNTTYLSKLLFFAIFYGSLNTYAQKDSTKSLRYPIADRNTDFFSTPANTPIDLKDPKIINKSIEYDPKTNKYIVYEKIGDNYYKTPTYMTYDEFVDYTNKQAEQSYFQQRSRAIDLAERKVNSPFYIKGRNYLIDF